jgi:hypothetical protein
MARARAAAKRSGEEVNLTEIPDLGRQRDHSILEVDEALDRLA